MFWYDHFYLSVLCEKIQITKLLSFGPLWVMDMLLNERYKGREDEEDYVSSCWMSVRKIYWNMKEKALGRTLADSLWRWLRTCHKTEYEWPSDWMNVVRCHLVWVWSTATQHDVIVPKCVLVECNQWFCWCVKESETYFMILYANYNCSIYVRQLNATPEVELHV